MQIGDEVLQHINHPRPEGSGEAPQGSHLKHDVQSWGRGRTNVIKRLGMLKKRDDKDTDQGDAVSYQEKLSLATVLASGDTELAERSLKLKQSDTNRWKDSCEGKEVPPEVKAEWDQLGSLGHGRNKKMNLGGLHLFR